MPLDLSRQQSTLMCHMHEQAQVNCMVSQDFLWNEKNWRMSRYLHGRQCAL